MIRLLVWIFGGLVLGGIIHIVTILGVPLQADRDAYIRVSALSVDGKFTLLPRIAPGVQPLPLLDPAMSHAVCRFSLGAGPIRIQAEMPDLYWSIALYNRNGLAVYSLSDRGAEQRPIDILIANAQQIQQIRENPPEDFENIIVLDWTADSGFAIIHALNQAKGSDKVIETAISTAKCVVFPLSG